MYGLFTYMKGEKWLHSRGNGLVNIPVPWSIWVLYNQQFRPNSSWGVWMGSRFKVITLAGPSRRPYRTQKQDLILVPGNEMPGYFKEMDVSKNRGKNPKMEGENHGSKPYEQMDDLGGTIIFGNTQI